MGVIAIHNNIDGSELSSVSGCGRLCDILPDFDFSNTIIIKNGERLTPEYELGEEEVVYVRKLPAAGASAAAVIVMAIGASAALSGIMTAAIDGYVSKATQKAQEEAQRRAKALAQQIEQLPFIKGAKNKNALGNGVQYVMGSVRNSPYMLTDGFYSIGGTDGDKLFYNAILSLGYGEQKVKRIYCGDEILVENESGITGGVHTVRQDSLFYDAENVVELRQPGTSFSSSQFKKKVVAVADGSEIKHEYGEDAEPLYRTCADFTRKVELVIEFKGLRQYANDSWTSRSVTVTPSWSNDDGATWHEFTFDGGSNTFTRNSKKAIRFRAVKEFTAAECYGKQIKIKLERSVKLESNSNEDCYLLFMQSYCYDNRSSSASALTDCDTVSEWLEDNTTRLGVRIIANDNTNDVLDEFACEVSGVARTWDGDGWSSEKSETRNPAAWALEVLTSDKHAHSQYSGSEIDIDSFGEWYEYCSDEGFYADTIITDGKTKKDILDALCAISGATIYESPITGKLTAAVDKKEDYPVALFNSQDVLSMSYEKSLERRLDGVKVTFTNRDNWAVDTRDVMLDGGEKGTEDKLGELAPEFVTDAEHAYKLAQRQLRAQELQPRTLSVKCGGQAEFYPLYSRVKVQFTELMQGIRSSVIKGVGYVGDKIAQLQIADYVDIVPGNRYGVIIQAVNGDGRAMYYAEVTGAGRTRTLSLEEYITPGDVAIEAGNVLSFGLIDDDGEFSTVAHDFKIYGIISDGDGSYTLTLKDYNEACYEYGVIPPYKSNITHAPRLSRKQIDDIKNTALDAGIDALELAKEEIKSIRTLSSLDDAGTAGDWGSYRNRLYQYINGAWTPAAAPGYLGAYTDGTPELTEGNFFLAAAFFPAEEVLLSDDTYLFAIGEYVVSSRKSFKAGAVYVALSDEWLELTDRSDWRYLVASADMERYGFASPEAASLAVSSAEPKCIGTVTTLEGLAAAAGSLVVYNGEESGLVKGDVYKRTGGGEWRHLDPSDKENEGDYLRCFTSVASIAQDKSDAFTSIFAAKLMALEATILELQTKIITLQNGGTIKSYNFDGVIDGFGQITELGEKGFAVTHAGESVFSNGYFRGQIDCGTIKATKTDIYQIKEHFSKSQINNFIQYIKRLAGSSIRLDTTTTALFGENNFIRLDDDIKYSGRVVIDNIDSRSYNIGMAIEINGALVDIGRMSGSVIIVSNMNYDYKQTFEIAGSSVLDFGVLPTEDPLVEGRAWNDNGTLKISAGAPLTLTIQNNNTPIEQRPEEA